MNIDVNLAQDVLAAIAGSSVTAIFNQRRLAKRRKEEQAQDPNRCRCSHDVNYHDEDGCQAVIKKGVVTKYDEWGDAVAWKPAPCACRRFVGPNSSYDPGLDADLKRATQSITPPANQPRIQPLPPYDAPSHLPRQRNTKGQRDV